MSFNQLKHTKPLEEEFDSIRRELKMNKLSFNDELKKITSNISSEQRLTNNTITSQGTDISTLNTQVQTILATPDAPPPDDYYVPLTGAYYFGDGLTEGDWRIVLNGADLEFQKLVSTVWDTKGKIVGT